MSTHTTHITTNAGSRGTSAVAAMRPRAAQRVQLAMRERLTLAERSMP